MPGEKANSKAPQKRNNLFDMESLRLTISTDTIRGVFKLLITQILFIRKLKEFA
jgi:hypothetical protein